MIKLKIFILLFSFFLVSVSFGQKVITVHKQNGYEHFSAFVEKRDTVKHGFYRFYKDSAQLYQTGFYENDMMEDRWMVFYPSGRLKRTYVYSNGEKNGHFRVYYPTGQLYQKGNYLNDKKSGREVQFNQSGSLAAVSHYIKGEKHGVDTFFYPNGNLNEIQQYIHGHPQGKYISFHEKGVINYKGYRD